MGLEHCYAVRSNRGSRGSRRSLRRKSSKLSSFSCPLPRLADNAAAYPLQANPRERPTAALLVQRVELPRGLAHALAIAGHLAIEPLHLGAFVVADLGLILHQWRHPFRDDADGDDTEHDLGDHAHVSPHVSGRG